MSTEAQLAANRANAQTSTGPRTEEGKARASANATAFGLFSSRGLVRPDEAGDFEELRATLLAELDPESVLENSFAVEILHSIWRLRRCLLVEEILAARAPDSGAADDPAGLPGQAAVDRARAQANATLRRSAAELRRLQTERGLRAQMGDVCGLASRQEMTVTLATDARRRLLARRLGGLDRFESLLDRADEKVAQIATQAANFREITKRTQSAGRNSPCPCGSEAKYKRCCGQGSPPMPGNRAATPAESPLDSP